MASPKDFYTWELSYLLIYGFKRNKYGHLALMSKIDVLMVFDRELLNSRLAVALEQLIIETRHRLFGTGCADHRCLLRLFLLNLDLSALPRS